MPLAFLAGRSLTFDHDKHNPKAFHKITAAMRELAGLASICKNRSSLPIQDTLLDWRQVPVGETIT